jgi:hypothetical protein
VFTKDLITEAEGESMIKGRKLWPWQFDQAEWSGKWVHTRKMHKWSKRCLSNLSLFAEIVIIAGGINCFFVKYRLCI